MGNLTYIFQPYVLRKIIRGNIRPRALFEFIHDRLGLFAKGRDCDARGGQHEWYNLDGKNTGCYLCEVIRPGRLWETDSNA